MKTTSPADRLAEILELMRTLAPDDPRTWALELGAWRVAAEAVGVARRLERATDGLQDGVYLGPEDRGPDPVLGVR